jgi:SH3-like domain-containing protein
MNRSVRRWLHRSPMFLAGGILLLVLLPGGQSSTVAVKQVPSVTGPTTVASRQLPTTLARPIPVALKSGGIDDRTSLVSASGASNTPQRAPAWWANYRLSRPSAPANPESTAMTDGRVGAQAVNARSGPAADADKLFVLAAGEPVKLGETSTGWVHIYRQSGESGWVYGRYLAGQPAATDARQPPADIASNPVPAKKDKPAKTLALVQFPMAVLAEPNEDAALLFVLRPGDRVRFAETRGTWTRVVTEDGISGWVPS